MFNYIISCASTTTINTAFSNSVDLDHSAHQCCLILLCVVWQSGKHCTFGSACMDRSSELFIPFSQTDAFCSRWLLKTLWQKGKFLKTSNFSFCQNDFNNLTFIYRDFLYFCLGDFKVVCCSFAVCGEGLYGFDLKTKCCGTQKKLLSGTVILSSHSTVFY